MVAFTIFINVKFMSLLISSSSSIFIGVFYLAVEVLCTGNPFLNSVLAQDSVQSLPTTQPFIAYTNSKFSLQYPENWKLQEDKVGVWFISPVDESGNFRVEAIPAYNRTLSEIIGSQFNGNNGFKILSANESTIDGIPANLVKYSFKTQSSSGFLMSRTYDSVGMEISALKNNTLYTVTYLSSPENFDVYLPIIKEMINSLVIH
jgi:PsbP-like protein